MKFLNLITLFSAAILLINSATLHAEDTSALATVPVTVYEQIDSAKTQVPSTQTPSTQTISRNNDSSSNKPIKHDELNVLFIPGLMSNASVWSELSHELGSYYKGQYRSHFAQVAGFADNKVYPNNRLSKITAALVSYIENNNIK